MTTHDDTADAYLGLAADWHGGQASALYSYASTGRIACRTWLAHEIRADIEEARTNATALPADAERWTHEADRLSSFLDWLGQHTEPCHPQHCRCGEDNDEKDDTP
ncbi:hypothetical protein [Streptomyces sp. TR02-1]|uniref:hypothetical protein n=1 Tax=Streptomyces sp. TR02-1 TaxID=3385977 RepID=UPI0039A38380